MSSNKKWKVDDNIIYSNSSGETIASAWQKQRIINEKLQERINRLRCIDTCETNDNDTVAFQFKVDTSTNILKIRDKDNSKWITLGAINKDYLGIVPDTIEAVKNNNNSVPSIEAKEVDDKPDNSLGREGDLLFDKKHKRIYQKVGSSWVLYSSIQVSELEGYDELVLTSQLSKTKAPNKILLMNSNSKLDVDITGNAETVGGKHPSDFVPATDVTDTKTPNKILRLNSQGKLDVDITGSAATIGGAKIDTSTKKEGSALVYRSSANGGEGGYVHEDVNPGSLINDTKTSISTAYSSDKVQTMLNAMNADVVKSIEGHRGNVRMLDLLEAGAYGEDISNLSAKDIVNRGKVGFYRYGRINNKKSSPIPWSTVLTSTSSTEVMQLAMGYGTNDTQGVYFRSVSGNDKMGEIDWERLLSDKNLLNVLLKKSYSINAKKSGELVQLGVALLSMGSGASNNGYPSEYSTVLNIPALDKSYPDCRQLCIDAYSHLWVRSINNNTLSDSARWERVITSTTEAQTIRGNLRVDGSMSIGGNFFMNLNKVNFNDPTSVINVGKADERYVQSAGGDIFGILNMLADIPADDNSTKIPSTAWIRNLVQSYGGTGSLKENGWWKFPGGLIIQWGKSLILKRTEDQTFKAKLPIAFPDDLCFKYSVPASVSFTKTEASFFQDGLIRSKYKNIAFILIGY